MGHLYRPLGGPRPQATLTDLHLTITTWEPPGAQCWGGVGAGSSRGWEGWQEARSLWSLPSEKPWPKQLYITPEGSETHCVLTHGGEGHRLQWRLEPRLVATRCLAEGVGEVQRATVAEAMLATLSGAGRGGAAPEGSWGPERSCRDGGGDTGATMCPRNRNL